MGRDVRVAEPRGNGGRDHQHGAQGQRAHEQRDAGLGAGSDARGVGAQGRPVRTGSADDHEEVRAGHGALGDHRAPGRTGDAEAGSVHEGDVQCRVEGEARDGDVERCAGVLEAADDAGGGEDHQHGRDAEGGDPQIRDRVRGDGVGGSEEGDQPGRRRQQDGDDDGADQEGEPDAVHALPDGCPEVSRADPSGDGRGGGVGEEDEDADGGGEQGRGDAETGQLGSAEVPHDGAVGHHEQGLGDERAESRDGEREYLAVVPSRGRLQRGDGLCHALNLIFHR